jgi:hypothetical protein
MHHHRAEHWIVVSGTAEVHCGNTTLLLTENQSTYIPLGDNVASLVYDEACGLISRHAELYGLRTLDSLQLATFLNYCEKEQDCFVCADRKPSAVVEHENIEVIFV